jgi:hypothetical protein
MVCGVVSTEDIYTIEGNTMAVNSVHRSEPLLRLTLKVRRVGKYYQAYCPELDVAAYGAKKDEARQELYKTATAVSSFLIAAAPDGSEVFDRELRYARVLERHEGTPQELFRDKGNGIKSCRPHDC